MALGRGRILPAAAHFLNDQRGSASAWNLTWLFGFCIMGGLSIDSTNGYRHKTMQQATADSAALAGVYSLPDRDRAKADALAFAELNMPKVEHGDYLTAADIQVGYWNREERKFYPDAEPLNAVYVKTEESASRGNPVGATLLRLIGFSRWNVQSEAIAARNEERCMVNGMLSASHVNIDSENTFDDFYCVYGRDYVEIYNGNDLTGSDGNPATHAFVGTGTSATERCGDFSGLRLRGRRSDQCDVSSNPGLEDAQFASDFIHPFRLYEHSFKDDGQIVVPLGADGQPIYTLPQTIAAFEADAINNGTYYAQRDWLSGSRMDSGVAAQLMAGGKYYLECNRDGAELELPGGDYINTLLLVTNCNIRIKGGGGDSQYVGTTFVSTSTDPDVAIDIRGGNEIGNGCEAGQGADFWTLGGMTIHGNNSHRNVKVTTAGGVLIEGNNSAYGDEIHSLSIHSNGGIEVRSSSKFSVCDNDDTWTGVNPFHHLVY